MTTFYDLVEATLAYDLMPQAVPELRSITVGGAIAGLGGQSSSFSFGLVHEMVTDFDLLTGEGKVIHCSPAVQRGHLLHAAQLIRLLGLRSEMQYQAQQGVPLRKTAISPVFNS